MFLDENRSSSDGRHVLAGTIPASGTAHKLLLRLERDLTQNKALQLSQSAGVAENHTPQSVPTSSTPKQQARIDISP